MRLRLGIIIYLLLLQFDAIAMANTIIIHGTWFPLISSKIHNMDCPYGLTPLFKLNQDCTLARAGNILNNLDPVNYPKEFIYIYGWSGALSFKIREQEALKLFEILSKIVGPITIIGHSHGGNIALNLAKVANRFDDCKLTIEKLILLACPVQADTENLVNSKIFKKIYHFYSKTDIAQVVDPQRIYFDAKQAFELNMPVFSKRRFSSDKVLQAAILYNRRSIGHNDFFALKFLGNLNKLIDVIEYVPNGEEIDLVSFGNKLIIEQNRNLRLKLVLLSGFILACYLLYHQRNGWHFDPLR